jgi:hypothetical protein
MDMACLSGHMAAELIASNQVDRYPQRLRHMVKKKFVMERRIGQLWGLFGYPLISCVLKSPELVKKIIFNKPPLPQVIGLIPSGRNFTSRCNPFAK